MIILRSQLLRSSPEIESPYAHESIEHHTLKHIVDIPSRRTRADTDSLKFALRAVR